MKKAKPFEEAFIASAVESFHRLGLDGSSAKLVATLYLEPEEIALEALAKKTGYSLASVSTKTTFLENLGMLQRVKKPGSKKVYVFVEKDLAKIQMNKIRAVHTKAIFPAKAAIKDLITTYGSKTKTEQDKQKMGLIKNYYHHLSKLEALFEKMIDLYTKEFSS